MTPLHGMASSGTYCERHLLLKVWGVQTCADDDGNAGAGIGIGGEKISGPDEALLETRIKEVGLNKGENDGVLRHQEALRPAEIPTEAAAHQMLDEKGRR